MRKEEYHPSGEGALAHRLQRRIACKIENGHQGAQKWRSDQLSLNKLFDASTPSMRKGSVREGEKMGKKGEKRKKNVFSGH